MAGAPRGNRNAEKPGNPGFTVTIRITKPMRERLEKGSGIEAEEELKELVRAMCLERLNEQGRD